jgi:hypothetical protein
MSKVSPLLKLAGGYALLWFVLKSAARRPVVSGVTVGALDLHHDTLIAKADAILEDAKNGTPPTHSELSELEQIIDTLAKAGKTDAAQSLDASLELLKQEIIAGETTPATASAPAQAGNNGASAIVAGEEPLGPWRVGGSTASRSSQEPSQEFTPSELTASELELLEQTGLVEKTRLSADARVSEYQLTGAGRILGASKTKVPRYLRRSKKRSPNP